MGGLTDLFEAWFKGVLVAVAIALSANALGGPSFRWRSVFISGILGAMITCEYYHLYIAVHKVPRDWALTVGVPIERWDCLRSRKGGKTGKDTIDVYDINPCFCPYDGYCKNMTSGEWLDPSVCPKDGTAKCWDISHQPVTLHLNSGRDCAAAQGTSCTKEEPCTPCALDAVQAFLLDTGGLAGSGAASRCRSCGSGNSGACNFVLDEGPYCWKEPGSREVEPCSICCSEPKVLTLNGTCH